MFNSKLLVYQRVNWVGSGIPYGITAVLRGL